jgi:hypothetical protein
MNGLKDVVGIISFKKENPNLLMHEIIFLDHVISSKDTLSHDILKANWKSNVWIRNIISCINRLGFSFLNEIMPTTSFKADSKPQVSQQYNETYHKRGSYINI